MTAKNNGAARTDEDTAIVSDAGAGAEPAKMEQESQPTPTETQPVRQDGLQIDGFGLPVNGVARSKVLAELKAEDPVADGKAEWNDTLAAKARKLTEKHYG